MLEKKTLALGCVSTGRAFEAGGRGFESLWARLTDAEFLSAVEGCTLEGEFSHRLHLRLAWILVRRLGPEAALDRIRADIRRFALSRGATTMYHETITRFWVRQVALAVERFGGGDFDAFLTASPQLARRELLFEFYDRETLATDAARTGWVPEGKQA